jgi:hypothetical protein
MTELHAKKMVNVVANAALESRLAEIAKKNGASGYTVVDARGWGHAGVQSGALGADSNVLFMALVADEQPLVAALAALNEAGHQLVVWVSEVGVLRKDRF